MGQFKDISIKDIMEEINISYFLPDIQREYVWLRRADEKKIEQLFDSIIRGYPISSFLFWKLRKNDIETTKDNKENTDKLNFQLYKFMEKFDERYPHNEKVNIEQINSNDLNIVLDGQQRLTSLYIGLKGSRTLRRKKAWADNPNAYEEKILYLNLKYKPNFENPDDNYEFNFLKHDELSKDIDKNWFKVGDIFNINSIISYVREKNLSDIEADNLDKLKEVFCIQKQISYFEETEKSLDKVLKIFIRVNSGGTELSYSDLLMSIIIANFSLDIRDLMNKLVDDLKNLGFSVMGRDQILKTCLILSDCSHVFLLRNFSKTNIHKIEKNWDYITEEIYKAIKLLSEFGYRNKLSSAYVITSIAQYLLINKNITAEDKREMLKFVWYAQINSYFTNSLDGKLETVSKAIKNNQTFKEINAYLKKDIKYPLYLSEDDINGMINTQYGSSSTLPILQILYPHLDYKYSTFHIDHIYPRAKFNKKNKLLSQDDYWKMNYLFNLQLLQGEENITKREKDPEEWLNDELKTHEKIINYKKNNYIDENMLLSWENFNEFHKKRNDLLINELKNKIL